MLGETAARRARLQRLAAAAIRHHVPLAVGPIPPRCQPRRRQSSAGDGDGGGGDDWGLGRGEEEAWGEEGASCGRFHLYRRRLTRLQVPLPTPPHPTRGLTSPLLHPCVHGPLSPIMPEARPLRALPLARSTDAVPRHGGSSIAAPR
jgi:hypothetical protein